MASVSNLIALAGAMIVLAVIPSPSVFLVVARAVASGIWPAVAVVIGIVCGDLIFILVALNGLAAIADSPGFIGAKYLGAAYLIWLGIQLWRAKVESVNLHGGGAISWWENLISGFLITISDPKAILFYLSFFPVYVDLSRLTKIEIAMIGAIAILCVGGSKLIYAYLAGRARNWFKNIRVQQVMNRVAATIIVLTGVMLGFTH